MKRILPTAIAIAISLLLLLDFFVEGSYLIGGTAVLILRWVSIVTVFAMILGLVNILRLHVGRAARVEKGWPYSLALVISALVVIGIGVVPGSGGVSNPIISWIFAYVYLPINATIFSLLAFFAATAAYRALRTRSVDTTIMLVTGVIVLLGQIPLGAFIPGLTNLTGWILDVPTMAAIRGILLGVALGTITSGLRVILGYDRQYLEHQESVGESKSLAVLLERKR